MLTFTYTKDKYYKSSKIMIMFFLFSFICFPNGIGTIEYERWQSTTFRRACASHDGLQ